jgi:hypothetical protein
MNFIKEGVHSGVAEFDFKMYMNRKISPIGSGNQLLLGLFDDCMYSEVILDKKVGKTFHMIGVIRNDFDEQYNVDLLMSELTNRYDIEISKKD